MQRRGTLICFTGIDGSGKSTLARRLVFASRQRGLQSKYVHNRFRPVLSNPLVLIGRFLFLRRKSASKDYSDYSSTRKRLFTNYLMSSIYEVIILLDYSFQVVMKVKFFLSMGENIVCDRYVYDTVVSDLVVDLNYSQQKMDQTLKRLFLLLPKPDIAFLIDVPEKVAYRRKRDLSSIAYLTQRRSIYLDLGKRYKMTILDGRKKLEQLASEIEKKVFQ